MYTSLAAIRNDYADHTLDRYVRLALPLYRFRGSMRVMTQQAIPSVHAVLLEAIGLGVSTIPQIAHEFGLDRPDAIAFCAALIGHGWVDRCHTTGGEAPLVLTDAGRAIIAAGGTRRVTQLVSFDVHVNPFTDDCTRRIPGVSTRKELETSGNLLMPHEPATTIDVAAVQHAVVGTSVSDDATIDALLDVAAPYADYLLGIDVFTLRSPEGGRPIIVAYRDGRQLEDISALLRHLEAQGTWIMPDEAYAFTPDPIDFHAFMDDPVADALDTAIASFAEAAEIKRSLATQEAARSQDSDEANQPTPAVSPDSAMAALAAIDDRCRQAMQGISEAGIQAEIHSATEHRDVLRQAFNDVRHLDRVTIISPGISGRVVDDELRQIMEQAIGAEIELIIGYAYHPPAQPRKEGAPTRAPALIKRLEQAAQRARTDMPFKDIRFTTHDIGSAREHILICGAEYAIVANFDLLSFAPSARGDEVAQAFIVFHDIDTIVAVRRRAEHVLGVCRTEHAASSSAGAASEIERETLVVEADRTSSPIEQAQ